MRGGDVSFGDYGLKAMEPCWMTARQIEAARACGMGRLLLFRRIVFPPAGVTSFRRWLTSRRSRDGGKALRR